MAPAMTTTTLPTQLEASPPAALPFSSELLARAYTLRRPTGDILIYSASGAGGRDVSRQYLTHSHEAAFGADTFARDLFVHAGDAEEVARRTHVRATFSRRHTFEGDFEVIPIPGHTPGSTAYLWDDGEHRYLFTGDTIYLRDGEWVAALLESSDRAAYLQSLALLRELDFDVLVPWVASAGDAAAALTDRADAQRRIDAIIEQMSG
jgi:glyoxylase-like metal-dependent hydrolase (beta-lactamase superfamily II)